MIAWQYGVILPLAGGITLGLAMIMKATISTEFVPQPTDRNSSSLATYIFDPIIICGGYRGRPELAFFQSPVLTPPYVKATSHPYYVNPHEDWQSYVPPKPSLSTPKIDVSMASVGYGRLACTRHRLQLPPKFPANFLTSNTSGLCKVSFIYEEDGRVGDVKIISCTHESLATPTAQAVKKWSGLRPDCLTEQYGQRQVSTLRYDLLDENGEILPLP